MTTATAFPNTPTASDDKILSGEFTIHEQGMAFVCTARGHVDVNGFGARTMHVDDLTIVGLGWRFDLRWIPIDMDCEHLVAVEKHLRRFESERIINELWKAEKAVPAC